MNTGTILVLVVMLAVVGCNRSQAQINWFGPDGKINWEAEREQLHIPVDTIVIHHTAGSSGAMLQFLSELELERIYKPFFDKGSEGDPKIAPGTPVWSGHWAIVDGKLVPSYAIYHFLVKKDGTYEQHMPLSYVGWHAGNCAVNNRSVGIVLDGNFEHQDPPEVMLRGTATVLVHLKFIEGLPITYMVDHKAVRTADTTCCGPWYRNGGRDRVIALAEEIAGRKLGVSFAHPLAVR